MSRTCDKFHCPPFAISDEPPEGLVTNEPVLPLWTFRPGEVAVDVGASWGTYTLIALALGAEVVAFEPADDYCRVLEENVLLNGWADRCSVQKVALSDGSEPPREWAEEVFGEHYPAKSVRWRTLDEYGLTRVDKMKVDVEGLELAMLGGAVETLRRCRPMLIVEAHDGMVDRQVGNYPKSIDSKAKILRLLAGLGYSLRLEPWGTCEYIVAT